MPAFSSQSAIWRSSGIPTASDVTERRKRARGPRLTTVERREKERLTVQIDGEVLNRLRNAVYWTPGLTLTGVVEQSISDAVRAFERRRGKRFPQRSQELKAGRPPG
jgi:hypothetical protein